MVLHSAGTANKKTSSFAQVNEHEPFCMEMLRASCMSSPILVLFEQVIRSILWTISRMLVQQGYFFQMWIQRENPKLVSTKASLASQSHSICCTILYVRIVYIYIQSYSQTIVRLILVWIYDTMGRMQHVTSRVAKSENTFFAPMAFVFLLS